MNKLICFFNVIVNFGKHELCKLRNAIRNRNYFAGIDYNHPFVWDNKGNMFCIKCGYILEPTGDTKTLDQQADEEMESLRK